MKILHGVWLRILINDIKLKLTKLNFVININENNQN